MIGNIPSWVDHMKVVARNNNRQKATSPQKRNSVYTRLSFVVIGKSFEYVGKSIICACVDMLILLLTSKKIGTVTSANMRTDRTIYVMWKGIPNTRHKYAVRFIKQVPALMEHDAPFAMMKMGCFLLRPCFNNNNDPNYTNQSYFIIIAIIALVHIWPQQLGWRRRWRPMPMQHRYHLLTVIITTASSFLPMPKAYCRPGSWATWMNHHRIFDHP